MSDGRRFGSLPYGKGLANWLDMAPSFSLERVETPLLMWGAGGLDSIWDWYAGLRGINKPVEMWFLPTGTHDLFQASQRLRMNQLLVDWFCFWLKSERRTQLVFKGETHSDIAKQYKRWDELANMQKANVAKGRPPLYKWIPVPIYFGPQLRSQR
jgi:hypothetical protein